jgi:hypothetical protein
MNTKVQRLTGRDLLTKGMAFFTHAIKTDAVTLNPNLGRARLTQIYGDNLTTGRNLAEFPSLKPYLQRLRSLASDHPAVTACETCVLLLIPHTHWGRHAVIRIEYRKDKGRIDIGEIDVHPDALYAPVSFVYIEGQPVPYEWMLERDLPDPKLHAAVLAYIQDAACIANTSETGFGIGYNYSSWMTPPDGVIGTIEAEMETEGNFGAIYTTLDYGVIVKGGYVGWPVLSQDRAAAFLSAAERALVEDVMSLLESVESEKERQALWERLKNRLAFP